MWAILAIIISVAFGMPFLTAVGVFGGIWAAEAFLAKISQK